MFKLIKDVNNLLHDAFSMRININVVLSCHISGPEIRSDVSIANCVRMNITRYLSRLWLISRHEINKFLRRNLRGHK